MKGLSTLIKLSKRELDELRRKMVDLENQKEQLKLLTQKLNEDLTNEMKLATQVSTMSQFFGGFSQRIKKRQEDIAAEIKALDKKMDKLRDEITAAFANLKKYEIAQENAKQRAKETANRKETIEFDDIAAMRFIRKQKEDN